MFKKKDDAYAKVKEDEYPHLEGGGLNDSGDESGDHEEVEKKIGAVANDEMAQSTVLEGFPEFDRYGPLFPHLTNRIQCETDEQEVVAMAISYDSKAALAIVARGDEHFELQSWCLVSYKLIFKVEYNGEYLKMNLIEQNNKGDKFAVAYQDNGTFFVSVVNNKGEELDNVKITDLLALDAASKPITGFGEPMITCCFLDTENDDLFIAVYHRPTKTQYHLKYSFVLKKPLCETVVAPIEDASCTTRNFPIKTFYSPVLGQCLTFYRQGFCSSVSVDNVQTFRFEKITDKDLGNMYLLFDEALVVRSSGSVLFFKINKETHLWEQYHELKEMRGQIYFIRGNIRIQVCTDEYVYFYKICKETFEPTLENVMYNNMQCSVMMFGAKVRFGVTFKANQPNFTIYSRKYGHNFKVPVDTADHEGAIGASLKSLKRYVVAHGITLTVYDEHTFKNADRHTARKL
jgi:hypothetical protein